MYTRMKAVQKIGQVKRSLLDQHVLLYQMKMWIKVEIVPSKHIVLVITTLLLSEFHDCLLMDRTVYQQQGNAFLHKIVSGDES